MHTKSIDKEQLIKWLEELPGDKVYLYSHSDIDMDLMVWDEESNDTVGGINFQDEVQPTRWYY